MMKHNIWIAAAAMLVVSTGASAAESSGFYTTHSGKSYNTTLPDGRTITVSHYYQLAKSDKADDPINNMESNCTGRFVVSKEGQVLSASGICFSTQASGDGGTWWWKADEIGTAKCPDLCGSFGWVEGYGSLKNAKTAGTWVRTEVYAEGSIGTYKSTYSRK
jgi:hypothetical protein